MKSLLLPGLAALFLGGCAAPPIAAESSLLKVNFAGFGWRKDGAATAVFDLTVAGHAPRPLYVKVALPTPTGPPEKVRQVVSPLESVLRFKGTPRAGWNSGGSYVFKVAAYRDPGHTELVDSLEQRSLCTKPPNSMLSQLRDE